MPLSALVPIVQLIQNHLFDGVSGIFFFLFEQLYVVNVSCYAGSQLLLLCVLIFLRVMTINTKIHLRTKLIR